MDFLNIITPAYAEGGIAAGFDMMSIVPLVLIFGVMYFLLIRPQQKKAQEQKQMQQSLQRGDRVLTNGGIFGEVSKVISPDEIALEIADGIKVRVATSGIATTLAAGTPTPANTVQRPAIEKKPVAAKKTTSTKKETAKKAAPKKTTSRAKTTKARTKSKARSASK